MFNTTCDPEQKLRNLVVVLNLSLYLSKIILKTIQIPFFLTRFIQITNSSPLQSIFANKKKLLGTIWRDHIKKRSRQTSLTIRSQKQYKLMISQLSLVQSAKFIKSTQEDLSWKQNYRFQSKFSFKICSEEGQILCWLIILVKIPCPYSNFWKRC